MLLAPESDLRVSLVQADTVWRDAAANRSLYGGLVRPLAGVADLVVLPETFTSGFGDEAIAEAETMHGAGVAWLRALADEVGAVVTGSMVIAEGGRVWNRLLWAEPGGGLLWYDKRHLFRMADEHLRYGQGESRIITRWRGWRVLPQVCYDLRFRCGAATACRKRADASTTWRCMSPTGPARAATPGAPCCGRGRSRTWPLSSA